jgi:hypothetical protein
MSVEWVPLETTEHVQSLELFARLLRPEVYLLEEEADDVLKAAATILDEPTVDAKKAEALRRRSELEAELAAINATLDAAAA